MVTSRECVVRVSLFFHTVEGASYPQFKISIDRLDLILPVPSDGCRAVLLIVRETLPAGSCPEGGLLSSWSQDRTCRTCSEERRLECARLFESRATVGL